MATFLRLLSMETGWRTADVRHLRWEDVDTTAATIVVAKQIKTAQSRAARAVVLHHIEQDKQTAIMSGDIPGWQHLTRIFLKSLCSNQTAMNCCRQFSRRLGLTASSYRPHAQKKPVGLHFDRRTIGCNRAAVIRAGKNEHVCVRSSGALSVMCLSLRGRLSPRCTKSCQLTVNCLNV